MDPAQTPSGLPVSDRILGHFSFWVRPFPVRCTVFAVRPGSSTSFRSELLEHYNQNEDFRSTLPDASISTLLDQIPEEWALSRVVYNLGNQSGNYLHLLVRKNAFSIPTLAHEVHHILVALSAAGFVDQITNDTDEICAYLTDDLAKEIITGLIHLGAPPALAAGTPYKHGDPL